MDTYSDEQGDPDAQDFIEAAIWNDLPDTAAELFPQVLGLPRPAGPDATTGLEEEFDAAIVKDDQQPERSPRSADVVARELGGQEDFNARSTSGPKGDQHEGVKSDEDLSQLSTDASVDQQSMVEADIGQDIPAAADPAKSSANDPDKSHDIGDASATRPDQPVDKSSAGPDSRDTIKDISAAPHVSNTWGFPQPLKPDPPNKFPFDKTTEVYSCELCEETDTEDMINCASESCANGGSFHQSCVSIRGDESELTYGSGYVWYCLECRKGQGTDGEGLALVSESTAPETGPRDENHESSPPAGAPQRKWERCVAACPLEGVFDKTKMERCASRLHCRGGEWFHRICIGIAEGQINPNTQAWYCPTCRVGKKNNNGIVRSK